VGSQFWVAFFGGVLAVGAIAYLNGRRLGLPHGRQRLILPATALALAVSVGIAAYFLSSPVEKGLRPLARRTFQVVSVVLYVVLAWIQKPADRRHQLFHGEYASLWKPGFLALGGSFAVTVVLVFGAVLAIGMFR
jgi:hypothetical protein